MAAESHLVKLALHAQLLAEPFLCLRIPNIVGTSLSPFSAGSALLTSSLSLALVEHCESRVLHEHAVELLELLERVLVVLTGALRQDVHLKVGVRHLLLVVFLLWGRELVTLALEFLLHKTNEKACAIRVIIIEVFKVN